jgi:hypothetical protein
MIVSGFDASPFLLLAAATPLGGDPEISAMHRISFRLTLFILVLSAIHMAAMAPLADSALHALQPQTLTSHGLPAPT